MGPVLGPLLLLPLVLGQAVTVSVGDRSEARARVQDHLVRYDVETRPAVRLQARTPRLSLSLGYSPSLTGTGVGAPEARFALTHSAYASAGTYWRRTRLSLTEAVSYGRQNFRAAAVAAPASTAVQPAPGTMPTPGQTAGVPGAATQLSLVDGTTLYG